ncbi:MAG: repressor LexA [Planctomycetes bacterium]|nr:repressor LexA [Planctomycetota bacterium]
MAGLRGKKLLTDSKGRARSSKLTAKARRLLEEYQSSEDVSTGNFGGINLLGRVAAGRPIEAVQDRQSLSLGDLFGTADDVFALEVVGDSMIEEGIDSGDYVVCKRSQTAGDGQLVVAIMDEEEVTLKRFYLEKDRVRLQPANEAYDPIYSNNCKIEAVVIGLLHRY